MSLSLRHLHGHTRRIVVRLIVMGVSVTLAFGAVFAGLLLGLSGQAAVMTGTILVVSGPTVVGPLFTGWMDPRGIVAAATASTFSAGLVAQHVGGASKILPVTFLVIVVTVAVYGLTAVPVARRLGVTRPARARPLLVGGDDWVIDLGRVLRSLGLDVLMWAGFDEQRQRISHAGLELGAGELLARRPAGRATRGHHAVLLLTDEDDLNALGSTVLQGSDGRLAPVTRSGPPNPGPGDSMVVLTARPAG